MKTIREVVKSLAELDDMLVTCMRCGMCQAVCSLYGETGLETDVARGKIALLDGLAHKMLNDARGVANRLNKCLLCGSCENGCPSGVPIMEIFLKARGIITAYTGLSPAKKMILRLFLAYPAFFDRFLECSAPLQKLFFKPANEKLGTSCVRISGTPLGRRHLIPLAPVPFHRQIQQCPVKTGSTNCTVAFFTGCLIDKIYPRIGRATLEVLEHHEINVLVPGRQACCGIPNLAAGDQKGFEKLVRYNLACFPADRFDYLVTACATCTSTIKKFWPMMLGDENESLRREVRALAAKTLDISQFLTENVNIGPPVEDNCDGKRIVTYHDPCHLKKSLAVSEQPRRLLDAIAGYRLKEMEQSDRCCGMGGSFSLTYYPLSADIAEKKRDAILQTGCSTVATSCPACMMQISDTLSRAGHQIEVRHPIELYAEKISRRP
jgi:glycolate oxidase iron-sulfur subunit